MVQIQIKKADYEKDSNDIAHLIRLCNEEKTTVLNSTTEAEEKNYLKSLSSRDTVFVARDCDNKFAGFASINQRFHYSDRLNHCGEVGTWVMPDFRRKSVGRLLWINGIFPWCEKQGFKHLGFFIMANNRISIQFYESLGFHICGYHRKLIYDYNGNFSDALEMELFLE